MKNTLLSILLKAYSDVPPMYFPIPGHPLISKNISLSCPLPCISHYRGGGDMIVKIFLVSCPPHVLANTGGGHEIDLFLLISGTLSFQALIKLITM